MTSKQLAIALCEENDVNPYAKGYPITKRTIEDFGDKPYEIWEYWEKYYILPILSWLRK